MSPGSWKVSMVSCASLIRWLLSVSRCHFSPRVPIGLSLRKPLFAGTSHSGGRTPFSFISTCILCACSVMRGSFVLPGPSMNTGSRNRTAAIVSGGPTVGNSAPRALPPSALAALYFGSSFIGGGMLHARLAWASSCLDQGT